MKEKPCGLSVLIVDDDADLREVLGQILESAELTMADGRQVTVTTVYMAGNGLEAVEKYKRHHPDLVLMDILMPDCDGVTATREIIRYEPAATVIGLSAYAHSEGDKMVKEGARTVLAKPFEIKTLLSVISRSISDRSSIPSR